MSYVPQQSDLLLLNQSERNAYAKIELLNKSFKIIERLEGELIQDSYSFNAESDIRKTYNLSLVVKDSSFTVSSNSKIWFDKYIKVYIGLYGIRSKAIVYYPVGTFLFENAGYSFDSVTNELSLSCIDRMAELTGTRNGYMAGLSTTIEAGTSIRDALVSAVTQLGGIEKYRIENIEKTVPYDLEFNTGATVFDIIKELRDLYAGWETFFDEETFVCQPYPTCNTDPIVLDSATIAPLIISDETSIDFTQMHNVVEIWGKCLETEYYTESVTYTSVTYSAAYTDVTELVDGTMFGFLASEDNTGSDYFKINEFASYPIVGENYMLMTAGRIKSGLMYVLKYVAAESAGSFYFCGEYQICSVVKLVSAEPTAEQKAADLLAEPTRNITYVIKPDSPFCSDFDIGEIRAVYSGGDYENIYSEDLASQRGEYELWKLTDLLESKTLKLIEVPWLDVNQKIEYNSTQYIVKTKAGSSTEGTMTISCTKFQPLYFWTSKQVHTIIISPTYW